MTWQPEIGSSIRPASTEGYSSELAPEDFIADWSGYYRQSIVARDELRARVRHFAGVKYGPHDDQFGNIFFPEVTDGAPIIAYFHGGRWAEGHADFYDGLAAPWVERGAIFISFDYRMIPRATMDDEINDAVAAIAWTLDHAADLGGDPNRVFASGHSAGAHLVSMATLTDWPGAVRVAGTFCQSGVYDPSVMVPNLPDPVKVNARERLVVPVAPVLVSYAVIERNRVRDNFAAFADQGTAFVNALEAKGIDVETVAFPDASHVETGVAFSDPASPLFQQAAARVFPSGESV